MPDKPLKSLWGSQGLEFSSWTQPLERHDDETWKGQSSGQRTVFLHARTPSRGRTVLWICLYALAWSMPSTLSPRMSCRGRQLALPLRDRRELKGASYGYMESACKFSPSGILHVHFCQDLLPRKTEFWSSQIWEKRIILSMQCWIQELSVHTYDAVCGSLWATSQAQETYYITDETAGNFLWQTQRIWWKLDDIQECFVKPSSFPANYQLPSLKSWCLLECIHCRRERILRLCDHYWPLLVASTMEKYIG